MHICIDSRMVLSSGIGTILQHIIQFLVSSAYETTLLLNSKGLNEPWLKAFKQRSCNAPIYSLLEQVSLPQKIPYCDVFWSPHYNIPLLPIRAKKRIATIHDACHLAFGHFLNWKQRFYARNMLFQAASRSHAIITDSKFSQSELSHYLSIPEERFRVVYPGVDFEHFSKESSKETKDALKKKYSLPSSYFLFVSNLKPHKNLSLILDVYEKFSIDIPLVVIGKKSGLINADPSVHRINQNVKLKSKIIFTDEVLNEELPIFYQSSIALVFPSLYEGFGLPPIEAMAAGCPTIVTNCASLPEVCGNAAYYFDPKYPDELSEKMIKMASDPELQSKFREKGKSWAIRYSWQETFTQYEKIFRE